MNFLAIDVETATPDYSSLCQIGIAEFNNGRIINRWETLVNPEVPFNSFNTQIHGISEADVIDAPTFYEIYDTLSQHVDNKITVHHGHFDRTAINQACENCRLSSISTKWLDSARIVRRTWTQFADSGYGLSNIAVNLGIEFEHHDALEDAITAGKIVHEACKVSGLSIKDWLVQVDTPIKRSSIQQDNIKINPDGHLFGNTIVFTGKLKSISRSAAKNMAKEAGCKVKKNMSKKVTLLVVGIQNPSRLATGHTKSSKQRKAEKLISKGHEVQIITEKEFIDWCSNG